MSSDQQAPVRTYTVLAVCTGNICRSPAVERLLAAELGTESMAGVRIASAGVRAVVGAAMPAAMASLVREAGASPDDFTARQLTEQMLRRADLVLALTREHRSRIVALYPGVVRRTFTVRELARLASWVDPAALSELGTAGERLAALLPLAAAQRGMRAGEPDGDDVVDPYGGTEALYRRAFGELRPAVVEIARVVRG